MLKAAKPCSRIPEPKVGVNSPWLHLGVCVCEALLVIPGGVTSSWFHLGSGARRIWSKNCGRSLGKRQQRTQVLFTILISQDLSANPPDLDASFPDSPHSF